MRQNSACFWSRGPKLPKASPCSGNVPFRKLPRLEDVFQKHGSSSLLLAGFQRFSTLKTWNCVYLRETDDGAKNHIVRALSGTRQHSIPASVV